MKKLLSYSNCQGGGLLHFLKKTPLAQEYEMEQWNNWQLIMGEQSREKFYEALPQADVLIYQPTTDMLCTDKATVPNSVDLIAKYIRPDVPQISFAYLYNAGFFPFFKASDGFDGWMTGTKLKNAMRDLPGTVLQRYDADLFYYDCARRFLECLQEQARREYDCTIAMAPWMLQNYDKRPLFLTQNHPTSVVFAELARRVYLLIRAHEPSDSPLKSLGADPWQGCDPFTDLNEANLPGALPIHPAVVRELGLKYPASEDYSFYRTWLEQWVKEHINNYPK